MRGGGRQDRDLENIFLTDEARNFQRPFSANDVQFQRSKLPKERWPHLLRDNRQNPHIAADSLHDERFATSP